MRFLSSLKISVILIFFITGCINAEDDPNNKSFTFVQLCDTQLGYGGYEHDINLFHKAVERINLLKPDFVVHCGDTVEDYTAQTITDFNEIRSGLTVPCYIAPGNHELGYQPSALTLMRHRAIFGKDYFSFEHKGYTFVIANSQLWKSPLDGETERLDTWFKETLKDAKDKNSPIFVVQHIPIYLEEPNEPEEPNYNLPVEKRKELLDLMVDHGVVAVLGGHKHQTIIHNYGGIQLVNSASLSKNNDDSPLGFRVWTVNSPESITHEFVILETPAKDPNNLIQNQ